MIYTNILREKNSDILNNFIKSLTAQDFDIEHYVPVSQPSRWVRELFSIHDFIKVNVADYEKSLINFFENPNLLNAAHPVILIIGQAGSGKSSTIKYTLEKANICFGCGLHDNCSTHYMQRILIDYIEFKSEIGVDFPDDLEQDYTKLRIERFWQHLIGMLDENLNGEISEVIEVTEFFEWFLRKISKKDFLKLYRILEPEKYLFSNPQGNTGELRNIRREIYRTLSPKDLAYYKLYQIAFLREKDKTSLKCNLLIFDNIDTLDAIFQKKLLDFALKANSLFNCKSIIPMRPQTLRFYQNATGVIEKREHWVPDFRTVINRRLKLLKNKGNEIESECIKQIMNKVWNNPTMKEIFEGTCGGSIRFGLRNLYNFLQSNAIVTHENGEFVKKIELDTNRFFQAFFCSDTSESHMHDAAFTNILAVKKGENYILSTIKLRILHKIFITGKISVVDLFQNITKFGFDDITFIDVMNDLLDSNKALLYSSSISELDYNSINNGSNNKVFLTPVGNFFYDRLVRHGLYIRECIAQINKKRSIGIKGDVLSTFSIIKKFSELDYDEVGIFVNESSATKYEKDYYPQYISVSYMLWDRLKYDIENSISRLRDSNIEIDYQRNNYVKSIIDSILTSH